MLARGVLCRLASDVPKTSTHDIPQLARLLHSIVSTRNGYSIPSLCALSRAPRASLAGFRRSYATTAKATKPTATVKKAVKKQAAKKPATPKKKVTAKKAKPAKKPAPKKKKAKKELTPEEKLKAKIRELRIKALREPHSSSDISAYNVFAAENLKGSSGAPGSAGWKEQGEKYRNLSTAEREHYNHLTNEKNAARKAEYQAWVRSYTPDQIRIANNARAQLRRMLKGSRKGQPSHTATIHDDRVPKRPLPAYVAFYKDRWETGDFKGIRGPEASKLVSNEWKALSASEKQKYLEAYNAEKAAYAAEYQRSYGHAPGQKA